MPENNIEELHSFGWKGKDEISVTEEKEGYLIIFHRKHKETREVYTDEVFVPKQDVKDLWEIIRKNCQLNEEYKYRYLVRKIIQSGKFKFEEVIRGFKEFDEQIKRLQDPELEDKYYNFLSDLAMETFNGGKFRKAIYFPSLYNPLKVLESKGMIMFLGRGGVIRLSDDILI